MGYNLVELSDEETAKMNVDLAASGVVFKERYNMPVIPEMVAREQPEALREYFCSGWHITVSSPKNYLDCRMNPK